LSGRKAGRLPEIGFPIFPGGQLLYRTGRLFLAGINPNGLRKASLPQFKTGIAREASFDEHSSDSAVANTKQFTVEATSYAQVFVASAVGCGCSSSHRLLADPDSVGKSETSTYEKDGECKPFAGFQSGHQRCT
jgi:hypothetical protein